MAKRLPSLRSVLLVLFAALEMVLGVERAHAEPRTLVVPANIEWFDTGIDVQASFLFFLTINATGNWTNLPGGQSVGPAGYGSLRLPNAIAPGEPFAALIGRIDETIFAIGDRFKGRSPATGRLYLAMNDITGTFGDNSGELTVVVDQPTNRTITTFEDPVLFLDLVSPDPQPFFARPSLRWTVRNKFLPPFNAELDVFLDGLRANPEPPPPLIFDLGPNSERRGTFELFTGIDPVLPAGDHTITAELRALTPNRELLATSSTMVKSVVPSPPPSIAIVDFKAEPDYQDQGKEVKLSWKLQPTSYCLPADLVLKKKDVGVPDVVVILQEANPSSPGEKKIFVTGKSSPLYYVLSVACKFTPAGTAQPVTAVTDEVKVSFGPIPPAATPNVVNEGPFFTPKQVKEKQSFSASWTFQNVGGAKSDEFDVQFYLDGVKQGNAETVPKFEAGQSKTLKWDIATELLNGIHNVELKRVSDNSSQSYSQFQVIP